MPPCSMRWRPRPVHLAASASPSTRCAS